MTIITYMILASLVISSGITFYADKGIPIEIRVLVVVLVIIIISSMGMLVT